MTVMTPATRAGGGTTALRGLIAPYQKPDNLRALRQIANSFLPYIGLWVVMVLALKISVWLTLALTPIAAGFLVRIFIIFHDCGHRSFMSSTRISTWVGYFGGMLTFTPYYYWNHQHALHHATAGNLDRRGLGDVWTLTLKEYRDASFGKRLGYRLYRNPFVMFILGPIYMFLISNRIAHPGASWRWHRSVQVSNLFIAALIAVLVLTLGWKTYLLIQLPAIFLAGIGGVWLFFVQHQYEECYWDRTGTWDYYRAALEGSSYYKLPRILQWFSGNIGFHHVHHLSPRIPNYKLERCHREAGPFPGVRTINLRQSLDCLRIRVVDEESRRMVGFGAPLL